MRLTPQPHVRSPGPVFVRGSIVLALALLTGGCLGGTEDSGIPGVKHPVTDPARPSTPSPSAASSEPPQDPEPTASFSQNGKTRVLYYGNTEVDATPEDDGIFTTVTVHNDTDAPVNYDIDVSLGDGVDWVASNKFRIESVPAHGVKSQASTVGGPHLGPIPQQPKIYIDALETY